MYKNKTFLAIIPARGGSKRLPKKNILNLAGKPLIAWTIETALKSKYIDRIVVSTDDDKIATVSKKYGADVPFMRPGYLATDESTSIDVVLHSLDKLEKNGEKYDFIILLQPTSPLRSSKNIDESIELLDEIKCDAVISVCKVEHSPLWTNTIPESGDLSNFLDSSIVNKRSQDLECYYRLNGAIYLCDVDRLRNEITFFLKSNCIAYKMKEEESIDIDNKIDFQLAEVIVNSCL
jgi:CMP-N,N'-diacetyllegionaminic acid synthase